MSAVAGSSTAGVSDYLRMHAIPESVIQQFERNSVDGITFSLLTEEDLRELDIREIRQRKYLLLLSYRWRRRFKKSCPKIQSGDLANFSEPKCFPVSEQFDENFLTLFSSTFADQMGRKPMDIGDGDIPYMSSTDNAVEFKTKKWKVLISGLYLLLITWITSVAMVFAHERLPDMSKYPPLPDIFLDNLPHISWAFDAAEWVGVVLSVMWIVILIFHRYRFILLRRFFALTGTVFLLRSVTMIVTSLSVPGRHSANYCTPYRFLNQTAFFRRVFQIWLGIGTSLGGIHTCGDYMFSGHTSLLTLLNFFITEYAPGSCQIVHTLSWVLNLFGVFFILASHEHYTLDVFAAIYVSSRLFLYYHCLANSCVLHQKDKERTMIWFPLFSFLEYDIRGIVPNQYEWPLKDTVRNLSHYLALIRRSACERRAKKSETLKKSCPTAFNAPALAQRLCDGAMVVANKCSKHDKSQ
ncbi:unnamed protein product [Calicophoron daubneyi]|uniref:Sphingomyelin synthase-like domain-containing protein n=1 Tax=Calicophoron daubneyi TaxID=300641 RepID=A0AAV2TXM8_CALDB